MPYRVYFEILGCKRRKLDIAKVRTFLKANDYKISNNPQKAEYIVLSTCAFKEEEEERGFERIDYLTGLKKRILILGCLPKIAPTRFRSYNGVTTLSPKNLEDINSFFENIKLKFEDTPEPNLIPSNLITTELTIAIRRFFKEFNLSFNFLRQSANYLKNKIRSLSEQRDKIFYLSISRGCLGKCSYCGIKYAVGKIKSKDIESILTEFERGVKNGYKEFIIMGDDTGAYGKDIGVTFPYLLSRIIKKYEELDIKLNHTNQLSITIDEFNPKWLITYKDELSILFTHRIIKSIICPIQSGSNRILDLMRREHTKDELLKFLTMLKSKNKSISLNTQIMLGFPTETEDEFNETLDFVVRGNFDSVIVFPYDIKENTPAGGFEPKISEEVINKRIKHSMKSFKKNKIKAFISCQ